MWQLGRCQEPHRRNTEAVDLPSLSQCERTVPEGDRRPASLRQVRSARGVRHDLRPPPPALRGGAHPPPVLPSSVHRGCSSKAPPAAAAASLSYQWTTLHVHHNHPSVCEAATAALGMWGRGVHVNTLALDIRKETFDGAVPQVLRLCRDRFIAKEGIPWCYMLRGSIPCVVVKGIVVCIADAVGGQDPVVVGEMPEGMRPTRALRFAAGVREPSEAGSGTATRLVTLQVLPNGTILVEDHRELGMLRGSEVDLSSVRFCMGNGMSLIDDVNLFLCDVNGTRIACLQGELGERFFDVVGRKPLALLPGSVRPREDMFFVSPGGGGGFHLLLVRPKGDARSVDTGDLVWRDSTWHRDTICVNGVMWEVAPTALNFENPMVASTATESQIIAILDFQRYLCRRFGSVDRAWHEAFDTDGSGSVNFTEFGLGCKAAGYVGNATKLWAALDIDRSGEISMEELSADTEAILQGLQGNRDPEEDLNFKDGRQRALTPSTAAPSRPRSSRQSSRCSSACGNRWNSRPSTNGTAVDVLKKTYARRASARAADTADNFAAIVRPCSALM